jgi:hypothetical protein
MDSSPGRLVPGVGRDRSRGTVGLSVRVTFPQSNRAPQGERQTLGGGGGVTEMDLG